MTSIKPPEGMPHRVPVITQDILNRITEAEDAARTVRNELKGYELRPMSALEGYRLANAVAQGLQAVREALGPAN